MQELVNFKSVISFAQTANDFIDVVLTIAATR